MTIFKVFNPYIANALTKKGFKIIGTEPNFKKPQYDVYLFEDKAELRVVLAELSHK